MNKREGDIHCASVCDTVRLHVYRLMPWQVDRVNAIMIQGGRGNGMIWIAVDVDDISFEKV